MWMSLILWECHFVIVLSFTRYCITTCYVHTRTASISVAVMRLICEQMTHHRNGPLNKQTQFVWQTSIWGRHIRSDQMAGAQHMSIDHIIKS